MIKLKAPRIYHLPWSEVVGKDDKLIRNKYMFNNKLVVATLKTDGESSSLYNDGTFHARSIDSKSHESRDWLHSWWSNKIYSNNYLELNERWPSLRLVGENMFARHTIKYSNLEDLFLLHSAWNGKTCLSWEDTLCISNMLDIATVPLLYKGIYIEDIIKSFNDLDTYNNDVVEGYIIRNSQEYDYMESDLNIAKFVSKRFKVNHANKHWFFQSIEKNEVSKNSKFNKLGEPHIIKDIEEEINERVASLGYIDPKDI